MKREEKRKIGFIFRVNLNSDGVYFNWGWVNFWVGLILNGYVMLYLSCK